MQVVCELVEEVVMVYELVAGEPSSMSQHGYEDPTLMNPLLAPAGRTQC